jgi:phage portal protein BeeE
MVYPPAYQQVLKGLPAVNYSARDVIYRPRNVRAHKDYGYSPVQQVLMTVNIALRRQLWQLDYYSEGSIPDALIGVPQGWMPERSSSSRIIGTPSSPAISPSAAAPSSCLATLRLRWCRPRSRSTRTTSTSGLRASSALPFTHDQEKWTPVCRKDHASLKKRASIALRLRSMAAAMGGETDEPRHRRQTPLRYGLSASPHGIELSDSHGADNGRVVA